MDITDESTEMTPEMQRRAIKMHNNTRLCEMSASTLGIKTSKKIYDERINAVREEMNKCAKDPTYWIEKYVKISKGEKNED